MELLRIQLELLERDHGRANGAILPALAFQGGQQTGRARGGVLQDAAQRLGFGDHLFDGPAFRLGVAAASVEAGGVASSGVTGAVKSPRPASFGSDALRNTAS